MSKLRSNEKLVNIPSVASGNAERRTVRAVDSSNILFEGSAKSSRSLEQNAILETILTYMSEHTIANCRK
jgi:hypothetical protein